MAKEKLTIEEKLKKRKYKVPNNFYWFIYGCLARMPMLGPKYHVHETIIDDIRKEKGPCFVIWNHLSRRDYLFLKNMMSPKKFNMVAGYSEFSRRKFSTVFKLANVIPKKNFTNDPVGIKAMTNIIKQGGCVAFSPEGSSSIYGCGQPAVPGTGRFLQFFRVPVYFMNLEGAYLTSHKVCIDDRVGKVNASMKLLFSKEDLKRLTPQEIEDAINKEFLHDDYAWNKEARVKFKTKHNACNRLDDILYKCPRCGEELSIVAKGDSIKCSKCGNGATLDDYYDFHPFDDKCVVPVSPSAWMALQRIDIINQIRKDPNYTFTCKAKVGALPKYKPIKKNDQISIICGEGTVTFNHDGIHFEGVKNNEPWKFTVSYAQYFTLLIENECDVFSFYVDGDYYDFYVEEKVVGKALMITEEMHRLHFNVWKNFKENAYMYHGTELEVENDNYEENVAKLYLQR